MPSRLYLGPGGEEGALRVLRSMNEEPASRPAHLMIGMPKPAEHESFRAPELPDALEIQSLRVTDFESWIRSPRRFWLERTQALKMVQTNPLDLDPRAFGILAHQVLDDFGSSDLRDSTDASVICGFLHRRLRECVTEGYGDPCLPTIELQARMLFQRLERFAYRQAELAKEGWRCEAVETTLQGVLDMPDGDPVRLTGRVDRIDRHEDGRWRVLDYKTSLASSRVQSKLTRDGVWKDLQLPLYDYLIRQGDVGDDALIEVGYFALPNQLSKVDLHIAPWDAVTMVSGVERAREIVQEMRSGAFGAEEGVTGWGGQPDGIDRILRSAALEFSGDASEVEVDE